MAGKPGRPSTYSEEIANAICLRLAEGASLRSICEADDMPAASTVHLWVVEDREGFSEQYVRARQAQALRWADEILDIADDGRNDTYETDKGESVNYDVISRSRLRVDTRKWMLSKMLPKVFGDKAQIEHSGPEGGPVEIAVTRKVVDAKNRIAGYVNGTNGANGNGKP